MSIVRTRPIEEADRSWVACLVRELWMADIVVVHGTVYKPATLPGFIADDNGEPCGLITYHVAGDECEIVTLDSLRESIGIGTALVEAVRKSAVHAGCRRLWVTTTNDNLNALGFYQKRGFHLVAVHPKEVDNSRRVKPEIPLIGYEGIPVRDEIVLEILL